MTDCLTPWLPLGCEPCGACLACVGVPTIGWYGEWCAQDAVLNADQTVAFIPDMSGNARTLFGGSTLGAPFEDPLFFSNRYGACHSAVRVDTDKTIPLLSTDSAAPFGLTEPFTLLTLMECPRIPLGTAEMQFFSLPTDAILAKTAANWEYGTDQDRLPAAPSSQSMHLFTLEYSAGNATISIDNVVLAGPTVLAGGPGTLDVYGPAYFDTGASIIGEYAYWAWGAVFAGILSAPQKLEVMTWRGEFP